MQTEKIASVVTSQKRKEIVQAFHKTHFSISDGSTQFPNHRDTSAPAGIYPPSTQIVHSSTLQLGFDKPSHETEFASQFKDFGVVKSVKRAENRDLYNEHFQLGYRTEAPMSSMKAAYPPHSRSITDCSFGKLHKEVRLSLGQQKTEFRSESQAWLTPKVANSAQLTALRRAHKHRNLTASVWFGQGEATSKLSMSSAAFKPRITAQPTVAIAQPESLSLGTDSVEYASCSQLTHSKKPPARAEFQSGLLKDLRKSHFRLGSYEQQQVQPAHCNEHAQENSEKSREVSMTFTSSFTLGSSKEKWGSTYKWSHSGNNSLTDLDKPPLANEVATVSHVKLGSHSTDFQTTFNSSYKKLQSVPASRTVQSCARKDHVRLGTDKRDWAKVSENYGIDAQRPQVCQPSDIEAGKHHFKLGYGGSHYDLSSTQQIPKRLSRVHLDDDTMKKLTSTSTQIGFDGDRSFDSTYAGAFKWVQARADTDFSVSYQ